MSPTKKLDKLAIYGPAPYNKFHYFVLVLTIFIAVAIRLLFLFQPIRYDEAFTFIVYASKPIDFIISKYYLPNNHIFHTITVRAAYLLLGNDPWILRLPSFLAGILIVPFSYIAVKNLYNKDAAFATAALTASSSILIEYSVLARGYTLICLLFLLITILGTHLTRKNSFLPGCLFVLISALGFYTAPIFLYPFGIIILWLLLASIKYRQNVDIIKPEIILIYAMFSLLLAFMLYIPVITGSGFKALFANRFVVSKSWSYFFSNLPRSLSEVWHLWNRDIPRLVSFIILSGFFILLPTHRKINRQQVFFIIPVIAFIVPALFTQRVVPFPRVWLFLLPMFFGMTSAGWFYAFDFFCSNKLRYSNTIFEILTFGLLIGLSLNVVYTKTIINSNESGLYKDAEETALFFKNHLKEKDKIFSICPSDFPLIYYFRKHQIPNTYLYSDYSSTDRLFNETDRLFIIVNEPEQTLNRVLEKTKIEKTNYNKFKLIQKYKSSSIYEFNR